MATALNARGNAYTTKALDEVIGESTETQREAPAYKYKGKTASPDVSARWSVDTIDLTQLPSKVKGEKDPVRYIVVAQGILARKVFAQAPPSVSPVAVSGIF